MSRKLENIRKIAVLRANGLGDYLFALPALQSLKAAYPEAEIVYLGCPWHEDFLANRPGPVDRVMVVPISHGVRYEPGKAEDPAELREFFEWASGERFDLAIQIHGGGRFSNPFLKNLGARITAGLRTPDAAELDISIPYIYYQSEVFRYLDVMRALGAQVTDVEPRVDVTERDIAESVQVYADNGRFAVLHPGATDSRRRWPAVKYAALGDYFARQGIAVLVTGTRGERELVEGVLGSMKYRGTNLCGSLTIQGLTGLLSRAALVVSNDSGPLHLAAAVGTPTVGIFWCGNLINGGPLTRVKHRPVISWMIVCPTCGMDIASVGYPFQAGKMPNTGEQCHHPHSFVEPVSVEEVIDAAAGLMPGQDGERRAA